MASFRKGQETKNGSPNMFPYDLSRCSISQHPSQIITGYLLSPRFSVVVETVVVGVVVGVVVVAVVVVVAMVVVGVVVVVGAVVVAGGGGGAVAGVGNRRCQKGKVGQG